MVTREIRLSQDILKMCEAFADMVLKTNQYAYAKRNQTDLNKIRNDIILGKLGEWGVYFRYIDQRRLLEPPDMKIYPINKKSFDADLQWNLYSLHIKTQSIDSMNRFGLSWMFEAKDPVLQMPNEYDIFVGCIATMGNKDNDPLVQIKCEIPFTEVIIGEPKLKKLNTKKCIYFKDQLEK